MQGNVQYLQIQQHHLELLYLILPTNGDDYHFFILFSF